MCNYVIKLVDGTYFRWADPYSEDSSTPSLSQAARFTYDRARGFVRTFFWGDEFLRIVRVRKVRR